MDEIAIYPYEFYNKSCCNLNICPGQNVIVNFDKIHKLIVNIANDAKYDDPRSVMMSKPK